MKKTVSLFKKMKEQHERITMSTCYDYSTAKIEDAAGMDMLLVGDSLGNTMLGYPDTVSVTMEDMIMHTAAVSRGTTDAFVLGDMPFMSYETGERDAMINAGRLMKEGRANGVKLEGGERVASQIKAIVGCGIPVCAHIGLTPQSINAFGGFKVQGKSLEAARQLIKDADAVEQAGAFMVVLECVPAKLAEIITKRLSIPTIGIGAGAECDGQVLVYQDMLGMFTDFKPKFVKHFGNIGEMMGKAFGDYISEVKSGSFPAPEHTYKIDDSVMEELEKE